MTRPEADAPRRRATLAGLGLGLALVVAACGGGAPASSSPAGAASPGDSASPAGGASASASASADTAGGGTGTATADDPCSLADATEISTLVGSDVTGTATEQAQGGLCTYTPTGDGRGFATITVFNETGPDLERAIADFSLGEVSVPVGDAAAGIDGTIFVQTGDTVFSIVATNGSFQPVPIDQLQTVAAGIVERLGGQNVAPSPSASPDASPSPSA